jgi:hypothetical protein
MRLRYDPVDDILLDERGMKIRGGTVIARVRAECREWCNRWDGARRKEIRVGKRLGPAMLFDPRKPPAFTVPFDRFEIELVRKPRPARDPGRISDQLAWERKMAMLNAMAPLRAVNLEGQAMQALRDYCAKDAEMAAKLFRAPPPLPMKAEAEAQIALAPKPPLGPRPKLSRWHSGQHFIEALCKRGYHVLGAGAYSTVLAKPGSNRVVKVCRKADTWLDYVVWAAKAGHAGRMAPNVFSYRRFNVGRPSEFYVAVMEKLEHTIATVQYQKPNDYRAYACLRDFIERRQDRDGLEAEKVWPGAIAFGIAFRVEFTRGLDLHGNNWMVRKDGSLVCTDPLCDESKTTAPERMRSRDLAALRAA